MVARFRRECRAHIRAAPPWRIAAAMAAHGRTRQACLHAFPTRALGLRRGGRRRGASTRGMQVAAARRDRDRGLPDLDEEGAKACWRLDDPGYDLPRPSRRATHAPLRRPYWAPRLSA